MASVVDFWWISREGKCMGALGFTLTPAGRIHCRSCGQNDLQGFGDHPLTPQQLDKWLAWKHEMAHRHPPAPEPVSKGEAT